MARRSATPDAATTLSRAVPLAPDAAPEAAPGAAPPAPPVDVVFREVEGEAAEPLAVPSDPPLAVPARSGDPRLATERPRESSRPPTLPQIAPHVTASEAEASVVPVHVHTVPPGARPPARAAIADSPAPAASTPVASVSPGEEAPPLVARASVPPPTATDASAPSVLPPTLRRSAPASGVPWSPRAVDGRDAAGEAPTVHVHIGRIEVRAVPPPTPARAARERPTPALTLDDYLSGRRSNGRGGRS